jgi:hypothetical protein
MDFYTTQIEGEAAGDWEGIQAEAGKHHRALVHVEACSESRQLSLQQIRWIKGILLPALAENGESVLVWENRLKVSIMPEKFIYACIVDGVAYNCIHSITILNIKETNQFMEQAVELLRNPPYDFKWVTLPDKLKRKT